MLEEFSMQKRSYKRITAVVSDLDGTIKSRGKEIEKQVLTELSHLRKRGIKLILVSGRCIKELKELLDFSLFDVIVAENGALVCREDKVINLAPEWWEEERKRLAEYFDSSCEEVIISAPRQLKELSERIVDSSKERIEFNVDRFMILPRGIDKGSGLTEALNLLGFHNDVGIMCIGDGENDLSLFRLASIKVAVRNSVDILKRHADYVTINEDGAGVIEALHRFLDAKLK